MAQITDLPRVTPPETFVTETYQLTKLNDVARLQALQTFHSR